MSHQIFISYASEDQERIQSLVQILERHGWSVWWDRKIPPGRQFDRVIEEAIHSASCMIVIWSEYSVSSDWVRDEASEGKNRRILVPILLDDVKIPFGFRRIEAANLLDWDGVSDHPELDVLFESITKLVSKPPIAKQDRPDPERVEKKQREEEKADQRSIDIKKETLLWRSVPKWIWIIFGLLGFFSLALWFANYIGLPGVESDVTPTTTIELTPVLIPSATAQPTHTEMIIVLPSPSLQTTFSAGSSLVSDIDNMEMIYIPAGEFLMGSLDQEIEVEDHEKPQHTVYLDAYWIDKTEITNDMFRIFVNSTGYRTLAEQQSLSYYYEPSTGKWREGEGYDWLHHTGANSSIDDRENHPVVHIAWQDAAAYCNWAGRRLPTEAEWEKAARGVDGNRYPWGDSEPDSNLLNFNNQVGDTQPVGSYPEGISFYGLYDMAGNVWEWINDWYSEDYYSSASSENPQGPTIGDRRVLRGGSWNNRAAFVRSANRYHNSVDFRSLYIGFRCAIDTPSVTSTITPTN